MKQLYILMKHKYVKHISGEVYEILSCLDTGNARLRNIITDVIFDYEDIHCSGQPENQIGKSYTYIDPPETESVKSEYYSVF